MSFTYALKVSYLGTRYSGWQKQPEGLATVQGELELALSNLAHREIVKTLGSGRTDTGVHAFGQIVRAQLDREIAGEKLLAALNAKLPADIRVIAAAPVGADFHPVREAKKKEYCYFLSDELASPFLSPLVLGIHRGADFDMMAKAAKVFEGEWDFSCYQTVGTPVKSTVRTIFNASLAQEDLGLPFAPALASGALWVFRVEGSGFLKQMVRLMVGAVLRVGRGDLSLEDLRRSLVSPDGQKVAAVAPAHGLYLHYVDYERSLF